MTHPLLQNMLELAGIEINEGYKTPYERKYSGKSKDELAIEKKYINSLISETHKDSIKHKQLTDELEAIENAFKAITEADESFFKKKKKDDEDAKKDDKKEEAKKKHEKHEDDEDADKDDKKEERKKKHEKKVDDEDADEDDKKEERKKKHEKKVDDEDADKDDKKEEAKKKHEKKVDDEDADKDDKKEERKKKHEKKIDDEDAKKDDKKEKLKESEHVESALEVARRMLANSSYLEYLPPGNTEDTKFTELKTLGKLELPKGYGLKTSNETGFKPLVVPAEDHPKEKMFHDIENEGKPDFGLKESSSNKIQMPKDVKKAVEDRIKELHKAIELDDGKGYNDQSVRQNAVDALTQVLQNTADGTEEGVKESQVFVGTLMSPITNLLPQQLFNWLGTALNIKKNTINESEDHGEYHVAPVEKLKKGEFVKRKAESNKVYILGDYDRETKRFSLEDANDMNREIFVKVGTPLVYGFTY